MTTINLRKFGKVPCFSTMGAMLRFKRETGKEATTVDGSSLTDLVTYVWCCALSASALEGEPLKMSLEDFADRLQPADIEAWSKQMAEENASDDADDDADDVDDDKKK